MSLVTMGSIAVSRDLADEWQPLASCPTITPPSGDGTAAKSVSFSQLLVAQIPCEALLGYTTLLALFTAASDGSYAIGRWTLYAAAIVVCAMAVLVDYFTKRDYDVEAPAPSTRLHLPVLPILTACLSMAVYGLTVPGSPLQYEVSSTAFGICSGCLAVGGGVMMSIFAPFLGRGNAAQPKA